ncbi:hypothetical protein MHI39_19995 [Heyndrickxia sp. FSL K6-6286]|uniref:hypothetical protein n=1 Tax=Heyndrickxia sp. FSL K6-6286 TaxID=2921510 RepID=UPI00315AEF0D
MQLEDALYIFNGHKFIDFIEVDKFKHDIQKKWEISEEVQEFSFAEYYEYLYENLSSDFEEVGKIFFENILYSHLKNIFVEKISAHPNLKVKHFKERVKQLITEINIKESIPPDIQRLMSENGFYLMDLLNITTPNTTFIAGFDYEEENGIIINARFLFVEVASKKSGGQVYFLAGIEIDFKSKVALTMVKNILGLQKDEKNASTTIHQIHKNAIQKIFNILGVSLQKPDVKSDRAGMFDLCKELDDNLLDDLRNDVNTRTDKAIKGSVKNLNKVLFNIPGDTLTMADKKDLGKKISSLLLSYYIEYKVSPMDLVRKAKKSNLIGYPTRVNFTSNKSSKSSTQSTNAKYPVSASDMFHSLYFNFEQALGLDSWSLSWFTDYKFNDEKDIDVIQTTIYSTSNQFRIVFLPDRPLNKEIIHYVIKTINSYR